MIPIASHVSGTGRNLRCGVAISRLSERDEFGYECREVRIRLFSHTSVTCFLRLVVCHRLYRHAHHQISATDIHSLLLSRVNRIGSSRDGRWSYVQVPQGRTVSPRKHTLAAKVGGVQVSEKQVDRLHDVGARVWNLAAMRKSGTTIGQNCAGQGGIRAVKGLFPQLVNPARALLLTYCPWASGVILMWESLSSLFTVACPSGAGAARGKNS